MQAFLALAALVSVLAIGCGGGRGGTMPGGNASLSGTITVFAASSLTDAFNEEKAAFEAAYSGTSVTLQFGGSATLVTQLDQGARADVLATAASKNVNDALQNGSVVDAGQTFARNKLGVIVPKDNPGSITTFWELGRSGLRLVVAEEGVPAGDYARKAFQNMEIDPRGGPGLEAAISSNIVSNEANVKDVVAKVQLGEADAGIVYVTDVTPDIANDVTLLPIPDDLNVIAIYPIAVTKDAANANAARAFIDFLLSAPGQQVMQRYGFLPPQ